MKNLIEPSNRITYSYVKHKENKDAPNGEDNGHNRGYTSYGDKFKAPTDGKLLSQQKGATTWVSYLHYTDPCGFKMSSRLCHIKTIKSNFKKGESVFEAMSDDWTKKDGPHMHAEYYLGHQTASFMQANSRNESAIRSIRTMDDLITEYKSGSASKPPTTSTKTFKLKRSSGTYEFKDSDKSKFKISGSKYTVETRVYDINDSIEAWLPKTTFTYVSSSSGSSGGNGGSTTKKKTTNLTKDYNAYSDSKCTKRITSYKKNTEVQLESAGSNSKVLKYRALGTTSWKSDAGEFIKYKI